MTDYIKISFLIRSNCYPGSYILPLVSFFLILTAIVLLPRFLLCGRPNSFNWKRHGELGAQ